VYEAKGLGLGGGLLCVDFVVALFTLVDEGEYMSM